MYIQNVTELPGIYEFNTVPVITYTDVRTFYGKGLQPLLWAGSRVAREEITISGITNRLNYCAILEYIRIIYKCGRGPNNTNS
jgi:hypothetical protein